MTATSRLSIRSTSKAESARSLTPALGSHVALLRGINVGGKNKLPMKMLTEMFAAAGCRNVRTYIQSGNVVFTADPTVVRMDQLATQIATAITEQAGLKVPVILRSAGEIQHALRANPFVKARVAEELLHVYFLAEACGASALKALDHERSPGDTFIACGREIYLHLPDGVARTKLTNAYFDRQLGTVSTLRNWRTVSTLASWLEMESADTEFHA